ncbi:MAG: VapC toxin family PIN domain ribonuclease [Thermoprotei archaeon]|nr:MAG: VapC toxin family PIN domain ribonuclease [Thermoprotei archaeon]
MIVVDASALSAFILREDGWRDLAKYMVYCASVDHVVKEVANAIWKAAYMKKLLTISEAHKAYDILLRIVNKNVVLYPELKYLSKAVEISMRYGATVYDSLYIALASEEGMPLLTLDELQIQVAEKLGVTCIKHL